MKCSLISLLILLFAGVGAQSQSLSGAISGKLTREQGPYVVSGDLTINPGDSLLIQSGVVVQFQPSTSLIVNGTLIIMGTESDSVRFRSASAQPAAGDWNGVFLQGESRGIIEYLVVKHASTGVTFSGNASVIRYSFFRQNNNGVDFTNGAVDTLQYNRIEHNRNAGIRAINAAPVIRSNAIIGNGPFGFESAIVLESSPAWISGNLIAYNSNSGIDIVNSSGVKFLQNTVVKNDMGITITDSDPLIENNIIAMNGFGVSAENSTPKLLYNDVWQNPGGNFYNVGSAVGQFTHTNAQGDSVDEGENLQANPRFVDASNSDFRILVNSPCVDAGDPGNPALIKVVGMAPDIGAYENSGLSLPVELVSLRFENGYLVWTTASETNNFGFYVQRSASLQGPFEKIAFVPGQGTRATPSHYRYRVDTPRAKTYFRLQQVDFDGSSWTSAAIEVAGLPTQLQLAQNYPNPFVARASTAVVSTHIRYLLPETMPVDLAIYNLNGQRVKTLVHAPMQTGEHTARWNGRNEAGQPVARGIYFIRLKAGHSVLLKRMMLIR